MADRTVDVTIAGKNELSPAFKAAGGDVESFGARVTKLLNPLNLLKGAIAGLGVVGLGNFFKGSIESATDAEAAWARVESAVTNTGISFNIVRQDLDKLFSSIQTTTRYSDDDAADAFARLLSITQDYSGSVKNLALATNIAAAKKIDLVSAAELVGKAAIGETGALKKQGIVIKEGQDAITELSKRFRGFAEHDAATMQGELHQVANAWDNVKEAVGRALLGIDATSVGTTKLVDTLTGLSTWIDANKSGVYEFATGLSNIFTWLLKITGVGPAVKMSLEGYDRLFEGIARVSGYASGPEDAGSGDYYKSLGRIEARRRREAKRQEDANARRVREERAREAQAEHEKETRPEREKQQREFEKLQKDITKGKHADQFGDANAFGSGFATPKLQKLSDDVIKPITGGVTKDISEATLAFTEFGDAVESVAKDSFGAFADTWADVTQEIVGGSISMGDAIAKAGRKAVGGVLVAKGRETLLDASKAAVEGFTNPAKFLQAAKLLGIGTAQIAVGQMFAGGGGGGGGSGLSGAGIAQQQREAQESRGEAQIIIKGGLLNMSDPEQADALANAIGELAGRRVIVLGDSR
jgi:hypothetical protein